MPFSKNRFNMTAAASSLLVILILVFPRSFISLRLPFILILFTIIAFFHIQYRAGRLSFKLHISVIFYYLFISAIGCFAILRGSINGANSVAIMDYLRLYILWSIVYLLVVCTLKLDEYFLSIERAFTISSVLIVAINVIGFASLVTNAEIFPESFMREMDLMIGIHDGYVQITSHNIGSVFFLFGYMFGKVMADAFRSSRISYFVLFILLALALLSGRRALWLAIFMIAPISLIILRMLDAQFTTFRKLIERLTLTTVLCTTLASPLILQFISDSPTVEHVMSAFSEQDERSVQKEFLIDKSIDNSVLGTGLGIDAGYLRNDERPWLYELTYHQSFMNFGMIISTVLALFFLIIFFLFFIRMKNKKELIPRYYPFLLGVITFGIGMYSNPYLASFDFLFVLAIFPILEVHYTQFGSVSAKNSVDIPEAKAI